MLHTTFASGTDSSAFSGGGKRRTHKNKSHIRNHLDNDPLNKTFKNRSRYKGLSNRRTYQGGALQQRQLQYSSRPQQQSLAQDTQVQNVVTDDTKKLIGLMYIPSDNPCLLYTSDAADE